MADKIINDEKEHKELLFELEEGGLLESIEVENDTLYRPTIAAKYKMNKSLIALSSTNNNDFDDLMFNGSMMTIMNNGVSDKEHGLKLSAVLSQVFKETYGFPKVMEIDHNPFFYYVNKMRK